MIPTSKSPIDVHLNKSSSGIWKSPEPGKRHFKSWQRLWIVSGIIYLLMLAGSCYLLIPDQESIERRMVYSVTEEVRRYDGMAYAGESPRKIFEIARSEGYSDWIAHVRSRYRIGPEGNAGFEKIEKDYREAVSALPAKRMFGLLICIVAWIAPMAVLYAIGYVVDWIKRGAGEIQG